MSMQDLKPADAVADLAATVRRVYGARALAVTTAAQQGSASSCGSGCCRTDSTDPITSGLYGDAERGELPAPALAASLGCGNPTALATLRPGDVVLDLGSGGGIDVLLSARRVGPTGFAWGLDMTDEMLALAESNRVAAGAENVRFLKGRIEEIPLPDAAVDIVLSNCVINLSTDKRRVLREAFRVLRPGGRFAVSDVVVQGEFPEELRRDAESWAGCIAGALHQDEYVRMLADAGFTGIEVQVTRVYDTAELAGAAGCCSGGGAASYGGAAGSAPGAAVSAPATGRLVSAFVRATKPAEAVR